MNKSLALILFQSTQYKEGKSPMVGRTADILSQQAALVVRSWLL